MNTTTPWQPQQSAGLSPMDADEVLYSGSDDDYYDSPGERQRQYFVQSCRFLNGRSMNILSAQLRGPFTRESGWQNPWAGKPKGDNVMPYATTGECSTIIRRNITDTAIPGTTAEIKEREIGSTQATVASAQTRRLVSSGTSQAATGAQLDSSPRDTLDNPYMSDVAWKRVQAWRIDIAAQTSVPNAAPGKLTLGVNRPGWTMPNGRSPASSPMHRSTLTLAPQTELARPSHIAVSSSAETTLQAASRGKRPANSQLLRKALAKKQKSSLLDQAVAESPSATGEDCSSPSRRRQDFTIPSAQDLPLYHDEQSSPDEASEAAIHGSITGQRTSSSEARKITLPPGSFPAQSVLVTPSRTVVARNDVETSGGPRNHGTLADNPPSLSPSRQAGVRPKVPGAGLSPLRPNAAKINAIISPGSHTVDYQDGRAKEVLGPRPQCDEVAEEQEDPTLDFCTQADRSFQYRSKAPKLKRVLPGFESPANKISDFHTIETGSGRSESSVEEAPDEDPARIASVAQHGISSPGGTMVQTDPKPKRVLLGCEHPADKFSSFPSTETASNISESGAEKLILEGLEEVAAVARAQNGLASPCGAIVTGGTTDKQSANIAEALYPGCPGIDGPTLIPTSPAPSLQQATPPSASESEKGLAGRAHDGQSAVEGKLDAPPESIQSLNTHDLPSNQARIVASRQNHHHLRTAESHAQISEKALVAIPEVVTVPLSVTESLGLETGGSNPNHGQTLDQEATVAPVASPTSRPTIPSPQQQSPWSKDALLLTQTPSDHEHQLLMLKTPIQQQASSEASNSPKASVPEPTQVQQSPWTKDTLLPSVEVVPSPDAVTLGVATRLSESIVPLAGPEAEIVADIDHLDAGPSRNPWLSDEMVLQANRSLAKRISRLPTSPEHLQHHISGVPSSPRSRTNSPMQQITAVATGDGQEKRALPSTPTQQSSLPTPDLTLSIKSFRAFMSPTPEPRRRSHPVLSSNTRIDKSNRPKSAISKSRKNRSSKAHLRVSFKLQGREADSSSITSTDPDETLDGAELPTCEPASPSMVRKASTQARPRRASSPPLELSQAELPAEGTKFSKYFQTQARKGPQVKRSGSYKPLLPSVSQQMCGSPAPAAMAEAFLEADRCAADASSGQSPAREQGDARLDNSVDHDEGDGDGAVEEQETEEIDDVTAVLDNLGDFLTSFDVDAELDKARREEQQHQETQHMGIGFPSTQDQIEIMGAGVWE